MVRKRQMLLVNKEYLLRNFGVFVLLVLIHFFLTAVKSISILTYRYH